MNNIVKNILSYALVIGIALLIKFFIFSPIKVNGSSMEPNLKDGDIMILNEIGYYINGVNRFDIVVVDTGDEKIIKRVIRQTISDRTNQKTRIIRTRQSKI